jgi:hypothetical protein
VEGEGRSFSQPDLPGWFEGCQIDRLHLSAQVELGGRLYDLLRSPQSMKRPLPAMMAAPSHVQ